MAEKERDGSGRFSRSVDDADVLGAVRAHDPAATSEIAEEVGVSRQGADRRLRSLREDGDVSSKKIGASLVWFMPRERGAPSTSARGDPTETTGEGETAERARTRDESDTVDLGTLSFDRDLTPARREQLREWLRYAADRDGGVSKSDFEAWWTDDRAEKAGYNAGSFWEAFAKAAMKQSEHFIKPNMRTYRYDTAGA
jgi:hypothetical protein